MFGSTKHTSFPGPGLSKKTLKSMGLKGFQIIYPAGGTQMSRADPVAWHVTGEPWKYVKLSDGALCVISNNVKWSKPWRKFT